MAGSSPLSEAGPDGAEAAPHQCGYISGRRGPHRELWGARGPSEMSQIKARGPDPSSLVPTSQRTRAAPEEGKAVPCQFQGWGANVLCVDTLRCPDNQPLGPGEGLDSSRQGTSAFTAIAAPQFPTWCNRDTRIYPLWAMCG